MPYVPFYERFPDIAKRETRSVTVFDIPGVPKDDYGLLELYCDEPGCDCRRVMFTVVSRRQDKETATIAYGWEDRVYYDQWFGHDDPDMIRQLQGPALNLGSYQCDFAEALLEIVKDLLRDKIYVDRIKRHYRMFRDAIDRKEEESTTADGRDHATVGRNEPCPCGSGKKYK